MRMVLVEWDDSCSDGGWLPSDTDLSVSQCVTTGFLQKDKPNSIVVAQNKSSSGRYSDRIAIPKGCIKRMRTLKVV